MKKIGMTWSAHVSHCVHGAMCSMSVRMSSPSEMYAAATVQWPSTTTVMEAARRKST